MDSLFEKTKRFLSVCDGAHEICKGLHWSAEHHAEHILTDDIDDAILDYQDKIAEVVMGLTGQKFQVGDLKALVGSSKDCKSFLNELESDLISYKKELGSDIRVDGLINVLDDFATDISKWKYLSTLL